MKFLIAGLGNIGTEYEVTRHNIGFLILDLLAEKLKVNFETNRLAFQAEGKYKGKKLILVKPTTYMNLSGKAINYWLTKEKLQKTQLMVVTDDVSLPFGKIRIRAKGSDAGHNGLKDIEENLGGVDYPRLRFGVGNNFQRGQKIDYVLGNFTPTEIKELPKLMETACDAILSFATIGLERTMNTYN
jgi:PTH1 family peptidyl-tRNA hydrolase